jgi:hypothetical protein
MFCGAPPRLGPVVPELKVEWIDSRDPFEVPELHPSGSEC